MALLLDTSILIYFFKNAFATAWVNSFFLSLASALSLATRLSSGSSANAELSRSASSAGPGGRGRPPSGARPTAPSRGSGRGRGSASRGRARSPASASPFLLPASSRPAATERDDDVPPARGRRRRAPMFGGSVPAADVAFLPGPRCAPPGCVGPSVRGRPDVRTPVQDTKGAGRN